MWSSLHSNFRGRSRIINQKCSYVTLSSNGDLDRQFDGFVLDHEAKRKILIHCDVLIEVLRFGESIFNSFITRKIFEWRFGSFQMNGRSPYRRRSIPGFFEVFPDE